MLLLKLVKIHPRLAVVVFKAIPHKPLKIRKKKWYNIVMNKSIKNKYDWLEKYLLSPQ